MAEADLKKASGITGTINTNVLNEVNIRDLSCTRDFINICNIPLSTDPTDRLGRLLGIVTSITNPVDMSDRANRLLGITYGSQSQQLRQRAASFELLVQLTNAGVEIDPRIIRFLTFATDSVDISGSSVTIAGTPSVDVTDRCARLLGQLCSGGIAIDPRQIRNLVFATDKVDASGSTVTTASGSVATMDDAFMELRLMADMLKDLPMTIDPTTSRTRVKIEDSISVPVNSSVITIGGVAADGMIDDTMDIVWNTGIRTNGII